MLGFERLQPYQPAPITNETITWQPPPGQPTEITHIPRADRLQELWDRTPNDFRTAFLAWSDEILTLSMWRENGWLEPARPGQTEIYPIAYARWVYQCRCRGLTHKEIRERTPIAWPGITLPAGKQVLPQLVYRYLNTFPESERPPTPRGPIVRGPAKDGWPAGAAAFVREHWGSRSNGWIVARLVEMFPEKAGPRTSAQEAAVVKALYRRVCD